MKPAARKAAAPKKPRATPADSRTDPDVVAFLRALDHPLKSAVESLRQVVLDANPAIREGIKWNSPSFKTVDWFATINLRARNGKERVWLILHTGATKKASATTGVPVADPTGLLEWLAKDRCLVTFADRQDVEAKRVALQAIVREWIGLMAAAR